jgi:hypothetical protein
MPVVLDATIGGVNANSFTTVAYANGYHDNQLYAEAWTGPSDAIKAQALITATRLIVNALNAVGWPGWPTTHEQRLPVPRSGMYYPSGLVVPNTIIPTDLQDATSEYARRLIENGALPDTASDTEAQSVGLKRVKAGSVEVEFDHGSSSASDSIELPSAVFAMISWMFGGQSRSTIPLVRA